MQVENHKEEVPFGHYQGLFEKAEAAEMAARTGVKWDGKEFYVNLLGKTYAIAHPGYEIRVCEPVGADDHIRPRAVEGAGPYRVESVPLPVQTFLLRYLLEGKQVSWRGGFKTFREMPWGELYIKPYTGRVLTRAAFTFGTRVEAFKAACEKMGATGLAHGDAGYQLDFLEGYTMQVMVWAGDDEFPPNAQVLYSDNFEDGFAPEDRVVAGDILISAIKANM
jgi:hypothetical protein